jgi:hypothetical protein
MDRARDIVAIAQRMIDLHGADARPIVESRARMNDDAGDPESARAWRRVAAAIRALEPSRRN